MSRSHANVVSFDRSEYIRIEYVILLDAFNKDVLFIYYLFIYLFIYLSKSMNLNERNEQFFMRETATELTGQTLT